MSHSNQQLEDDEEQQTSWAITWRWRRTTTHKKTNHLLILTKSNVMKAHTRIFASPCRSTTNPSVPPFINSIIFDLEL